MKFKKYVFGLSIALFTGLAYAFIANAMVPDLSHAAFIKLTLLGAFKDVILWLRQHPAEEVSFGDTVIINKSEVENDSMKQSTKQNIKTGGLLGLWIGAAILVCHLVGCVGFQNLKPTTKADITTGVESAAEIGIYELLKNKPTAEPKVTTAINELVILETGPIDVIKLKEIIMRMPVQELQSTEARIIVGTATVFIANRVGFTPIEQIEDLRPIITAIRSGLQKGVADFKSDAK